MATLKKYYYVVHECGREDGDDDRYTIYTSDSKEKLLVAVREAEADYRPKDFPHDSYHSHYIDEPAEIKEV